MALDVFWHCYIMDLMKKLRLYDVPRKSRSNLYLTRYLSGGFFFFSFFLSLSLAGFLPFFRSQTSLSFEGFNTGLEGRKRIFQKKSLIGV